VSDYTCTLELVNDSRTLADIAEASGLPARTIRFYIARGLLSGPVKGGRGAAYTADHLAQLNRIKNLQAQGLTLSEIAHRIGELSQSATASPPTAWWQHAIAGDVVVWVKAGAPPWRMRQVRTAIEEFARQIGPREDVTGKGEETV
jgi:DNA-binding transcriptional MerR regulator